MLIAWVQQGVDVEDDPLTLPEHKRQLPVPLLQPQVLGVLRRHHGSYQLDGLRPGAGGYDDRFSLTLGPGYRGILLSLSLDDLLLCFILDLLKIVLCLLCCLLRGNLGLDGCGEGGAELKVGEGNEKKFDVEEL